MWLCSRSMCHYGRDAAVHTERRCPMSLSRIFLTTPAAPKEESLRLNPRTLMNPEKGTSLRIGCSTISVNSASPRTADAGTPSAEPETHETTTATASFSRSCSCSAIPMRARSRGGVISSFHCLMREPVDTIPPAMCLSAKASSSVCNEGLTESSWTYHGIYPSRPHSHMSVLRPEEPMG